MSASQGYKLGGAVVASLYGIFYISSAHAWHLIDNLDLLIHEAGHWIFLPFGIFIHVLMGSGFQILFPCVFVGYFVLQRAYYSASITLFWPGFNMLNVAIYAGDAQRMQLPLLGGDGSFHDWNWIFNDLGVLRYTDQIAGAMFAMGCVVILAACVLSISTALHDAK